MTKVLKNCLVWVSAWFAIGIVPSSKAAESAQPKPAETLYLQLGQAGLDESRIYKVRGASITRPAIQITLEDGTIGFTQDVMGRVTGAFFEGDGEILLTPPNEVERRSLSLFTGMAILEERFATAYFRFNDDVVKELGPDLRAPDNAQEFASRWAPMAKNLAQPDAMRLLVSFSRLLPADQGSAPDAASVAAGDSTDRFFHARLQGNKFGVFDVYYDSTVPEQVQAGQAKTADGGAIYYDVWTSFSPIQGGNSAKAGAALTGEPEKHEGRVVTRRYTITTDVVPPRIHARAKLECEVRQGGARTLLFELSRYLDVESVRMNGHDVEFIHNPATEGTQLSRRGNDAMAVILPEPARTGQTLDLEFVYGGEVLATAGNGLLYVGARGTWYPNRGLVMADFDLQFSYPQGWTLVATGKSAPVSAEHAASASGAQTSRWVSERPIPLAGFNLGKYREVIAHAGSVEVETYATQGVERDFPTAPIQVIEPAKPEEAVQRHAEVIVPSQPSPVKNEVNVGESAARAIEYFANRFGPFPYNHLALTQMPGRESQGWPELVFLSSFAFLTQEEREQLHIEPFRMLIQQSIPAHEAAHQYWGDLITWSSYRDQWFSEGLANYCALMMMQERNPAGFREIMNQYRLELVAKNKDGMSAMDAGPVTLGTRLLSSRFPEGYEAISYGRGTWLFHMLRTMLRDGAQPDGPRATVDSSDEPFVQALRRLREKYEGKAISTRELIDVFAESLPPALRYEGKTSLDWFLEGWINGTSLPKLELKNIRMTPKGSGLAVTGVIVQKEAGENLVTSVPVYAATTGKQLILLGRVFADGEETPFRLSAPAGSRRLVLDPYETVLTATK